MPAYVVVVVVVVVVCMAFLDVTRPICLSLRSTIVHGCASRENVSLRHLPNNLAAAVREVPTGNIIWVGRVRWERQRYGTGSSVRGCFLTLGRRGGGDGCNRMHRDPGGAHNGMEKNDGGGKDSQPAPSSLLLDIFKNHFIILQYQNRKRQQK